jgi:hypothetical protein
MTYDDWVQQVPTEITDDSLWKVEAYRLALFVSDLSWHDTTKLVADRRTLGLSDQLYRSVGSIGANLAEGYSRGTGRDRARFYENLSVRRVKAVIGTTRVGIFWAKRSLNTLSALSHRSSGSYSP